MYLFRRIHFHYTGNMESEQIIQVLTALAQTHRLAVFRLLVQAGSEGMSAGKIAETLAMPASSLSFHLKELQHAGLITPRQEGRFIIYSASYHCIQSVLAYLTENCCGGKPC